MRIIFLDFDGVLNSVKYDRERDITINTNLDESRLPLLKQLVDVTQAKIVLSTSWRRHWNPNLTERRQERFSSRWKSLKKSLENCV